MGPANEENLRVVNPNGSMTIDQAASMREEILAALDSVDRVIVNMSHVTEVDLSFIQLLLAAEREARDRGKEFRISGDLCDEVQTMLVTGGFCRSACSTGTELESQIFHPIRQGG